MNFLFRNFILLGGLLYCTGCAPTISKTAEANLEKPVNCATARSDIKVLEEEKASVGKRMLTGVRSILPASAVVGILSGDYGNRVEVASGTYNEHLENKITEIRTTCRISEQEVNERG